MPALPILKTVVTRDETTFTAQYDFSSYRGHIRDYWLDNFHEYFNCGLEPIQYLRSILESEDAARAIRRAASGDDAARARELWTVTELLIEGAPAGAWGSEEKVVDWLRHWSENQIYEKILLGRKKAHQLDLGLDPQPTRYGVD